MEDMCDERHKPGPHGVVPEVLRGEGIRKGSTAMSTTSQVLGKNQSPVFTSVMIAIPVRNAHRGEPNRTRSSRDLLAAPVAMLSPGGP